MNKSSKSNSRKESIESILKSIKIIRKEIITCKSKHSEFTHAQWGIIHELMKRESTTTKELSDVFGLTKSAITQQVNSLEKKGVLERNKNPEDHREQIITITDKFKDKTKDLHKTMIKKMAIIFEVLDDKELDVFEKLQRKIACHLIKRNESK